MPVSPMTNANGNERVVAVPITPSQSVPGFINANGTQTLGTIVLGQNNLTNGVAELYVYSLYANARFTAAASGILISWQWQFQNAAHAAVGGAIGIIGMAAGCSGAGAAGVLNNGKMEPAWPWNTQAIIPATAVEVALLSVASGILGAPAIDTLAAFGVDTQNGGSTGDIGGAGLAAQSPTSPNEF